MTALTLVRLGFLDDSVNFLDSSIHVGGRSTDDDLVFSIEVDGQSLAFADDTRWRSVAVDAY